MKIQVLAVAIFCGIGLLDAMEVKKIEQAEQKQGLLSEICDRSALQASPLDAMFKVLLDKNAAFAQRNQDLMLKLDVAEMNLDEAQKRIDDVEEKNADLADRLEGTKQLLEQERKSSDDLIVENVNLAVDLCITDGKLAQEKLKLDAVAKRNMHLESKLQEAKQQLIFFKQQERQQKLKKELSTATSVDELIHIIIGGLVPDNEALQAVLLDAKVPEDAGVLGTYLKPLIQKYRQLSAQEGLKEEARAKIVEVSNLLALLEHSFFDLNRKRDDLAYEFFISPEKLATFEKVLGSITVVLNSIFLVSELAALGAPALIAAGVTIAGGVVLTGGTVILVAGIASAVLISLYAVVHLIKEHLKAKREVRQSEVAKELNYIKQASKQLLVEVCSMVEVISQNIVTTESAAIQDVRALHNHAARAIEAPRMQELAESAPVAAPVAAAAPIKARVEAPAAASVPN